MARKRLLSTKILDFQPKIGPFFFKEFLVVFLSCFILFFCVLLASLFFELSGLWLVLLPAAFLALVALIRHFSTPTSPWYLHRWVARRFVAKQHLVAKRFTKKFKQCPKTNSIIIPEKRSKKVA